MNKLLEMSPVVGALIAIAAGIAFGLGAIDMSLFVTFLGLGGFSGLAGLRQAIDSSGYKTFIIAGVGIVTSLGLAANLITVDVAAIFMSLLGVGSVGTLDHAHKKV